MGLFRSDTVTRREFAVAAVGFRGGIIAMQAPSFLIGASVFGGSSGSPVFILNQGAYATRDGGINIGSRFHFIGVIAAVFLRKQWNEIVAVPIPTATKPMVQNVEMIDLGIVFKARTVVETIEAFLKAQKVDTSAPAPQAAPGPAPQA